MLGVLPQAAVAKAAIKKGAEKYKNLNKEQKQAVNIGGLVILAGALFVGYKVYSGASSIFSWMSGEKREEEDKQKELQLNKEIAKEQTNEKPTISDFVMKGIANQVYESMDGMGANWVLFRTQLLKLKNKADWLLLNKEFGVRESMSLMEWIPDQFSAARISQIRSILLDINVNI